MPSRLRTCTLKTPKEYFITRDRDKMANASRFMWDGGGLRFRTCERVHKFRFVDTAFAAVWLSSQFAPVLDGFELLVNVDSSLRSPESHSTHLLKAWNGLRWRSE